MALMRSSLYDALRNAGSTDDMARKAGGDVAAYDNRFNKVEADLTSLKRMIGFNLAISTAVSFKLFS